MRHNQNRRSRSRNRKGPNPLTRSYESNGPDVKVRGTAAHVAEKYMTLARDAQSSGDIVAAENYLQHAEHYNRMVMAAQAQVQQERQAQFGGDAGYEDDRGVNGPVDRFGFSVDADEDEEPDRFDSTEEEQERTQPRPPPVQQMRPDDRQGPRGPRNDQRPEQRPDQRNDRYDNRRDRPDQRPDNRNDQRPEPRGDFRADQRPDNRPDARNEPRNDRNADRGNRPERAGNGFNGEFNGERFGRGERFDRAPDNRPDQRPEMRNDRPAQPQRTDRPDHNERDARADGDDPQSQPDRLPPGDLAQGIDVQRDVPAVAELMDAQAPAPRRRRGRPPRAEAAEPDATPDGAAALLAFPE